MPAEFIKCTECGKIFAKSGEETLCSSCRNENEGPKTEKESLRLVRNFIRDLQAKGIMMTLEQVVEETGVDYATIWSFIQRGEIDLARFDDPQVKSYLLHRRRDQEKRLGNRAEEIKTSEEPRRHGGFHATDIDKRER